MIQAIFEYGTATEEEKRKQQLRRSSAAGPVGFTGLVGSGSGYFFLVVKKGRGPRPHRDHIVFW
jgi:hypothetical protein